MRRILFAILLIVISCSKVFGTTQYSDKIIYDGKEYGIGIYLLEIYFRKYPDKRPKTGLWSTALQRGYIATFEIKNNQLYVKDIVIEVLVDTANFFRSEIIRKSVLNEVFPNQELVKADWFNGLFVFAHGERLGYNSDYYYNVYENVILLEIHEGNLRRKKHFDSKEYAEFIEKQLQAFKKTEEYERIKAGIMSDEYIRFFYKFDFDFDEHYYRFHKDMDVYVEFHFRRNIIRRSSKILVEPDIHLVTDYFKGINRRTMDLIKR